MEGFSFVIPVTGLNSPNIGKEDDDEEIKSRLNSGYSCCNHAVWYVLSSHLQYKNIRIKIYRTIILPYLMKV
jgi:hypothetical protein